MTFYISFALFQPSNLHKSQPCLTFCRSDLLHSATQTYVEFERNYSFIYSIFVLTWRSGHCFIYTNILRFRSSFMFLITIASKCGQYRVILMCLWCLKCKKPSYVPSDTTGQAHLFSGMIYCLTDDSNSPSVCNNELSLFIQ